MAQSVGPTASATAGATNASGGVGGSDVQLDDAEVRCWRQTLCFEYRVTPITVLSFQPPCKAVARLECNCDPRHWQYRNCSAEQ